MPCYVAFHLDFHCFSKCPFRGFQYTNGQLKHQADGIQIIPDILLILIYGKPFAKVTKDKTSRHRVKLVVGFGEVIFVNLGITSTVCFSEV